MVDIRKLYNHLLYIEESLINQTMNLNELKNEVLKCFILSQSLEPLADKKDCTTRYVDSSPGTKLKYFTISAVNSVWQIMEMVNDIVENNGKPTSIFKYAYYAQKESIKNRMGGKVNYSQILMLLPIIHAQCILSLEGKKFRDIDLLLKKATSQMKLTTIEDVKDLQRFVDLAILQSVNHNKKLGKFKKQLYPKFIGFYQNIFECMDAEYFSHTMMATEIKNGYPECKRIFDDLNISPPFDLIEQSEKIYPKYHKEMIRHDIAADCIVVGFYLVLIARNNDTLFQ